ncbi:MAG: hypothetical protein WCQ67_01405 [Treponema sp.]
MSNSTVQYIKTQNAASVNTQNVLHGGSSVYVRVLKNNGNGNYTVSFAGNRFNVKSMKPLSTGQSFNAKIQEGQNGKILLVPSEKSNVESIQILKQSQVLMEDGSPGSELSSYLIAQGLVPNAATVSIMKLLQQSGFKTDVNLMRKAQVAASKFKGNEKRAAEVAILLLEDGIEPTEENIQKILSKGYLYSSEENEMTDGKNGNDNQSENKNDNQSKEQNKQNNENKKSEGQFQYESNKKTDKSTENLNLLSNLYENADCCNKKGGLLTLINQIASNENHWIILPFEWNNNEITCSGVIRVLININNKNIEKILINCKTSMKKYFFVIYFNGSKVKEVRFCTLPPLLPSAEFSSNDSAVKKEEMRLGELFSSGMNYDDSVTVAYSPTAFIDGLCTDGTPPAFIQGAVDE